jgi:predicted lipid-binding transport protein (Tim44 family)
MRRFIPVLLAALLLFVPVLSQARPGQGTSMGSRGSQTWSSQSYGAAPMQRSLAPNSGYGSSGYSNYGGYGYHRPMFGGGMMGGLLGAGLFGMLLGGGFFGFHGGGGFLGLILQLVILFFLARWAMRAFLGAPAMAGMGGMARNMFQPGMGPMAGSGPRPGYGGNTNPRIAVGETDYKQFTQVLLGVQAAWTATDLNRLRQFATPEMVSYFAEQLAELQSRGVRNQVSDVRLLHGDLSEAWSEGSREYATVSK